MTTVKIIKGGYGSGNFGHAGRPGEVGGSAPSSGGVVEYVEGYKLQYSKTPDDATPTYIMDKDGNWISAEGNNFARHTQLYAAYIQEHQDLFDEVLRRDANYVLTHELEEDWTFEDAVMEQAGLVSVERDPGPDGATFTMKVSYHSPLSVLDKAVKRLQRLVKSGAITPEDYESFYIVRGSYHLIKPSELELIAGFTPVIIGGKEYYAEEIRYKAIIIKHLPGQHDQSSHNPNALKKPHGYAGLMKVVKNKTLGRGWCSIYDAAKAGLDASGGKYVDVCETHNTLVNFEKLSDAKDHLPYADWCEECQGAAEAKGGRGSGNFRHRGRPGLVGGSVAADRSGGRLILSVDDVQVDEIDDLRSYTSVSGTTYAYFAAPNDQLIDIYSDSIPDRLQGEHAETVNEFPEVFGLSPSDTSLYEHRYSAINRAMQHGYIRIRFFAASSDDAGSIVGVESAKLDTPTLRRLQRLYDNNKLFMADEFSWEGKRNSLTTDWATFIDAKRVVIEDGQPVLKQEKRAVITKGGEGSGNFGHAGIPGHLGGSARNLDYDAVIDRAIADKQSLDNIAGDWLKENFDIPYEMNGWAQYNDRFTSIRDSYVVNDERTLRNNRALRNGDDPKPANWADRIDKICESKFKYDSQVYRSAALSQDIVDKIIQTKSFQDNGFMSVSGGKRQPEAYLAHRLKANKGALPVMFHIKAPAGSHVGLMDNSEFIFPRGTKIHIDSWKLENGRYEFIGTAETP